MNKVWLYNIKAILGVVLIVVMLIGGFVAINNGYKAGYIGYFGGCIGLYFIFLNYFEMLEKQKVENENIN